MTKNEGKLIIEQKIKEFQEQEKILKKKGHGETNIRTNFIDFFFKALDWQMDKYTDVVREFSQKDTSGTKKVDYAFLINGKLKFFVEAKESSIDLEHDRDAIYQAKRYAFSTNGKAPIVILTDFEEFRTFNVLKAPLYDNTERELLKSFCFKYTDYTDKWDLVWDTFSKEAVINGSLNKLIGKIDKNTKTMDVEFLEQITEWRQTLAKHIAVRNKDLTVDEINESVQRILDRLIFIRNLEDREIEPENTMLDIAKNREDIYKNIVPLFNKLNAVYNGLLFKKHFSENIIIDDSVIREIIKKMCYPVSPFRFDIIEPEILGRIYEKFLGSKIRLTESHQAKVEEKMEVRKAGGVYYTPEYIVNYIVENTVGKKIEGLSPDEIKNIKIADPACGSGSFLLGAFSHLINYHEKWYLAHKSDKKYKDDYYITKKGELKVRLDKRADILKNNIFGVDIDKEATEVAIMSLYLKMLDEGFDKGQKDLFFIKGHILPDMADNIKCGNSLIGTDYFDGSLNFDNEEFKKIKPFDWDKE
ncbi:MAG: N-6 DNA methylase, partial [Spirochaetes bacterium]|nr:N-6 DNA methylase [Spirochaetota bacterium]